MSVRLGSDKSQQIELVTGGGINSNANVFLVRNSLLSPCTFAGSGKNYRYLFFDVTDAAGFCSYFLILAGFLYVKNYSL